MRYDSKRCCPACIHCVRWTFLSSICLALVMHTFSSCRRFSSVLSAPELTKLKLEPASEAASQIAFSETHWEAVRNLP